MLANVPLSGLYRTENEAWSSAARRVITEHEESEVETTFSSNSVKLALLTKQLADRFERLGLDEEGHMDPEDKKLLADVREQADKVLTEPVQKPD